MSYGHVDKIAGQAGGDPAPGPEKPVPAIDPALYQRDDVRRILAALDIGALYRILQDAGVSQRQIAGLTGQSQSEVSEIVAGRRKVENHQLLKRIVTGLGILPERMGLSWWGPDGRWYGSEGAYPGEGTAIETPEGVSAAMLRRHLIAHGGRIIVGVLSGSVPSDTPIAKVGELLDSLGELPRRRCHPDSPTLTWPRCMISGGGSTKPGGRWGVTRQPAVPQRPEQNSCSRFPAQSRSSRPL